MNTENQCKKQKRWFELNRILNKKFIRIAIVNSSSFGQYFKKHIQKLSSIGKVNRFIFDKNISGKELAKKLKGYHIIIASVTPNYTKEFFENNKDVFLITRHGIGINNIDIKSATEHNVIVTKVSGIIEKEAMAEHTITLMLATARKIVPAYDAVMHNRWKNRASFVGIELKNKKIGIIGCGNIGERVVEILKNGFNSKILVYDPYVSKEKIKKLGAKLVSLDKLIVESDIISLHASLNKTSYHLLKEKHFRKMNRGIIIINTARGELIEEKSLIKYLKNKKIAGLGLDVVEGEPINKNHPLLNFDNTVIVPHIGAYTLESLEKMGNKVIDDIEKVLHNRIPEDIVNPEIFNLRCQNQT